MVHKVDVGVCSMAVLLGSGWLSHGGNSEKIGESHCLLRKQHKHLRSFRLTLH